MSKRPRTAALSAQPRGVELDITETMLHRACEAYDPMYDACGGDTRADMKQSMRRALEAVGLAAPQPREVRGVDAGWIFYFTDDEGTPFVHFCGSRDELEQAVINHWFQGDDAAADDGQRMAPGIADELARSGVFHAEDGSCYAKPINVSIAGLGVGRVDLRQEKVSVGVTSSSLESVPATADGAHEVQPEAIEAGLGLVGGELGLAADANPHSDGSIHLIATTPQDAAAPGVGND